MKYKTAIISYAVPPSQEQMNFLIGHLNQLKGEIKDKAQAKLASLLSYKLELDLHLGQLDEYNYKLFYNIKPDNPASKKLLESFILMSAKAGNVQIAIRWGPSEEWVA